MPALVLAASLQELSETLERTPFKGEYTVWREGLEGRFDVTLQYSPPDMARLTWHTPGGDITISADGERFYTFSRDGASSLRLRELFDWLAEVHARLSPRIEALAAACEKPQAAAPLGDPRLRLDLMLSRTGDEERPFSLNGGLSLTWDGPGFGWLDLPEDARAKGAGDAARFVVGDLVTELDADTGVLRSLSILGAGGKKLASVERRKLEQGKSYPRAEFSPGVTPEDSRAAWKALCAGALSSLVLSTSAGLLPEDVSELKDEARRALDALLSDAADEVLARLFDGEVADLLARGYARVRAPTERVLRMARVSMEMQLRGMEKGRAAPEGRENVVASAWRGALRKRFQVKVAEPVLKRLADLLSKRAKPWP